MDESIDFVFTYVDFSDDEYKKLLIKYAKKVDKKLLKSKNLFLDRYIDFDEIYYSVQSVKKYLKFVRKIYIVTSTPYKISKIFKSDNKIIIINDKDILDKNVINPCFKSTVIESYLYKIPDISNIFMYGCDDMFIVNNIKKEDLFENNIPVIDLKMDSNLNNFKNLNKCIKSQSAYFTDVINTNRHYYKHFNEYLSLNHNHQITIIRKDICIETHEIFKDIIQKNGNNHFRVPKENNIHFILLHHLVGLKKNKFINKKNLKKSGFYQYIMKNVSERLGYLKDKKVSLFCLNDMNIYFYKYFQFSIINNIKKRYIINKIIFLYNRNDFLYLIPNYDKYFKNIDCKLLHINNFNDYNLKNNFDCSIILYIDNIVNRNIENKIKNFFYLFINSENFDNFIEDIYFFLNKKYNLKKIDKNLSNYNDNNFKINLSKEMKIDVLEIRNNLLK